MTQLFSEQTIQPAQTEETRLFNAMQEKRATLLEVAAKISAAEKVTTMVVDPDDFGLGELIADYDIDLGEAADAMLMAQLSYYEFIEKEEKTNT